MEPCTNVGSLCREMDLARWIAKGDFYMSFCIALQFNWPAGSFASLGNLYLDWEGFAGE